MTVLLAATPPAARAQCDSSAGRPVDVVGQVIDARALVPLRATVVLTAGRDTIAAVAADSTGFFAATVCRRASVVAHFRRLGYRADSMAVASDSTRWTPLDVAMTPLREPGAVTLAATRVTAPRTVSAIESRARRAGGLFIGAEEIDRLKPDRASDLFRARRGVALEDVDGAIRLVSSRGGRPGIIQGGSRASVAPLAAAARDSTAADANEPTRRAAGGTESCPLRIGVNGHLMPEEYQLDEMAVADIVAIEVYPSVATMPVQFSSARRGSTCGLAMIWTRGGVASP
jgi:hypothetical protein